MDDFAKTPGWAIGQVRLAPLGLLAVMAKRADYQSWTVRISDRQLAKITKTRRETIARYVGELADAGAITILNRENGSTPLYRINQSGPAEKADRSERAAAEKPGHRPARKSDRTCANNEPAPARKPGHISEAEKPRAAAEAAAANLSWEGEGKGQLAAALGLHPGSLHALLAAIRSDAYLADLEHDPARLVEVWGRKALRSARAAAEADTARRNEEARRRQPRPKPEPPCTPRTTKRFRSIVAPPPPADAADPEPDTTTPADPDTTNQDRHPSQHGLRAVAVGA